MKLIPFTRVRIQPTVSGNAIARCLLIAIVVIVIQFPNGVRADLFEATLYDGTLQEKTPDQYDPPWLAFGKTGGTQAYDDATESTNLDTTSTTLNYAGYSNFGLSGLVNSDFPTLDRQLGYTIGFRLQMLSEFHLPTRPARAGFSIIAVSNDVGSGVTSSIEIGFQDGRVFAQADDFGDNIAGQSDGFNPVGGDFIDYELSILGNTYDLVADGVSVLSGALHDYTAFEPDAEIPVDPYETADFIFLGDDTTSAHGNINLQRVTISAARVPEPSSLAIMSVGVVLLATAAVRRRYRRRAS